MVAKVVKIPILKTLFEFRKWLGFKWVIELLKAESRVIPCIRISYGSYNL